ncbi:MAG: hypothetical protein HeimC3_41780 [Candidatus Heimdallarchaeota archaeon LC_3]|nr:MAG: hypothetical protein HeimC3_41780 [Candidatus Heimdallarchaeota archaeon LC_3]
MNKITSGMWFWGFMIAIFFLWLISLFQGDRTWRTGVTLLSTVTTSMIIQILFPIIVPIRFSNFNKTMEELIPIRLEKYKPSDYVNGLLYNGMPSNHFGMILVLGWIGIYIYSYDPLVIWLIISIFGMFLPLIFAFSVIY